MPRVEVACGCHPHNAKHYDAALEAKLRAWLAKPSVVALGEIGLDYHYDFSPVEDQKRAFRAQLRLARELGLSVVLHVREAYDDAWEIMREEWFGAQAQDVDAAAKVAGDEAQTADGEAAACAQAPRVLLHCFTADWETLEPWIEAGCCVSFGGALTFGNADAVRDAAARVPLGQLLLETDAPYMAPKPLRGQKCESAQIVFTAQRLLEVRGITDLLDRFNVLHATYQNALELFHPSKA